MTAVKEISKYNLYLMGVQVRWDRGGTEPAGEYTVHISMERGMRIMN
jgi:hypothetical protein